MPGAAMETLTFPRYSPDDIVCYLRSHILAGAEARNLVKGDVFGTPKVGEGRLAGGGRGWPGGGGGGSGSGSGSGGGRPGVAGAALPPGESSALVVLLGERSLGLAGLWRAALAPA